MQINIFFVTPAPKIWFWLTVEALEWKSGNKKLTGGK